MKVATVTLRSVSPMSQSRSYSHEIPKEAKENYEDYEQHTWKNKCHTINDQVFIPPMAIKQAIDTAAKMLGKRIPGKGQSTYSKFFRSGLLCMDPILIGTHIDDVKCDRIFANADGVRGSGKRVWRLFPRIDEWEATTQVHILADEITPEVFEEHLIQSGHFVGIGRFRPENGGFYGRFEVSKISWN